MSSGAKKSGRKKKKKKESKEPGWIRRAFAGALRSALFLILLTAGILVIVHWSRELPLSQWLDQAREERPQGGEVAENAEEKGKIFIEWSDPSKSARRKGDPAPAGVAQNEKQPLDETPSPRFSASLADSVVDLIATGATGPWRPNLTREREIHRATGFLVHRGEHFGVLLTAAHLVTQGVPDIVLPGDNKTFPAEVWKTSRAWDLALLRVSERALEDRRPPMELATGSARRGDPGWIVAARQVAARHRPQFLPARRDSPGAEVVRAVGDAYGWTVPRGGWAVYLPQERTFEGYSGAPVLDRDGKVRGMVVGAVDRDDGTQVSVIVEGRILRRFLSQALASDQGSSKSR